MDRAYDRYHFNEILIDFKDYRVKLQLRLTFIPASSFSWRGRKKEHQVSNLNKKEYLVSNWYFFIIFSNRAKDCHLNVYSFWKKEKKRMNSFCVLEMAINELKGSFTTFYVDIFFWNGKMRLSFNSSRKLSRILNTFFFYAISQIKFNLPFFHIFLEMLTQHYNSRAP